MSEDTPTNYNLLNKMAANSSPNSTTKPMSPPPLMAIDHPNPPNVTISKCTSSTIPALISNSSNSNNCANQSSVSQEPVNANNSQFLLNTRQMVTASRLDPELLLTSCANKDIDDVDLDRMYMEAMLEDMKCNMSTR